MKTLQPKQQPGTDTLREIRYIGEIVNNEKNSERATHTGLFEQRALEASGRILASASDRHLGCDANVKLVDSSSHGRQTGRGDRCDCPAVWG